MNAPTTRLKNVAEIRVSNVDKKSVPGEQQVRLCNYVDVYKNQQITADMELMHATASADQIRTFQVRAGDTLVTKDSETADDIAVPAYVRDSVPGVLCGYHLAAIRPTSTVWPKYLYWALASLRFRSQMSAFATGVTRFGLRQEVIGNSEVCLPSLEEQRRVADFLDAEVGRLETTADVARRLCVLLNERRNAQRDLALRGEHLSGARHVHPILGELPRAWPTLPVRRVVPRVGVGVVVDPSSYYSDKGVPFLRGSNVLAGGFDLRDVRLLSEANSSVLWRSQLSAGDVVVVRAGYPGRAAVVPKTLEGANCASLIILKKGSSIRPEFLEAYFNSPLGTAFVNLNRYGAAQEQINVAHVVTFEVPVPPLREQDSILSRLREIEATVNAAEDRLARLRLLLAERRTALITAAVTGEFDVSSASGLDPIGLGGEIELTAAWSHRRVGML